MTRDRQQAALDRLRAKGNHLAPVMVDGKVRPKGSDKRPAGGGVLPAHSAPEGAIGVIMSPGELQPLSKRFPGDTFELLIPAPGKFLSLNDRMHHHPKARLIKAWRQAAVEAAETAGLPKGLPRVHVGIAVVKATNRAYDVHNLVATAKAAIDGLIDYGLCADDSNDYLTGPDMRPGGTGDPALRVVVTVLEVMAA